MSNCPSGFESIAVSQLKAGRQYRYKSRFGEAEVKAVRRVESGRLREGGWHVQIIDGQVELPIAPRIGQGREFFVRDSERVMFEVKSS